MLRFTPANLGNLLAQANEELTAFEDLILRSDTSRAQRRKALEATFVALNKTIEAFRNVNIPGIMPGLMTAKQENVIPPEVLTNLRLALSLQKEVMDRTAQTAFLMRKRSDDLSVQKAPDHLRLASLGQKALEMVERLQQRDNIGDFAQNLLEITGSLSTAVQLLNQGDLKNAASVVEAALENSRNSIIDMRSAAEWAEDEKASKSLLSLAIRLSKSYELLREINSELRLWGQARRAMVTKDDREEASVILRDQERALSLATKFSEALKKSIDSDTDEIVVTAFSAKQNMQEACERLRETNFVAAEAHQRQAIQDVMKLRRSLERGEIKYQSASTWAEEDPIELPEHVQTTSAGGFTDEIRNYSDQQVPARFEAVVRAYYDSLMRP
jgi:tetratricopeptide (TPR) repeat protein